jgi:hypothetical protein
MAAAGARFWKLFREFLAMRRVLTMAALTALTLVLTIAARAPAVSAAGHDGLWSVLIITEKGTCDRGYRYSVNVAGGRVTYQGSADVNLSGTVAPSGAVKVSIKRGDQGASGTGRLSDTQGAGTWRGAGSGGACAGRWEAERH